MAQMIHFMLEVCPKCNHTHSQIAVADEPEEDCELNEQINLYQIGQGGSRPYLCSCGERLVARAGS